MNYDKTIPVKLVSINLKYNGSSVKNMTPVFFKTQKKKKKKSYGINQLSDYVLRNSQNNPKPNDYGETK